MYINTTIEFPIRMYEITLHYHFSMTGDNMIIRWEGRSPRDALSNYSRDSGMIPEIFDDYDIVRYSVDEVNKIFESNSTF